MYYITYEDGTKFRGGDYLNSLWGEIEDKLIIDWSYFIGGFEFTLRGYEAYNHLVTKVNYMGGIEDVLEVILMAKIEDRVEMLKIDLKTGDTTLHKAQFGKEYQDKPTSGWKRGRLGEFGMVYRKLTEKDIQ
jgi:hypothetical protein